MEWVRGKSLGCGSFSTVNLALLTKQSSSCCYPSLMAVKSSGVCDSALLMNEEEVLRQLGECPQIVQCFGDDQSFEKGQRLYNLFLEYASGGCLADYLKKAGGRLPESEVRNVARSVLEGLRHIHAKGFAHCDLKLQNLLVFDNGDVKIADFGLAKRTGDRLERIQVRGTPLYMSPESVNENEYDSPCDIWALGCAVIEMLTGRPPWNCKQGTNVAAVLIKIGVGDELPEIPEEISDEGKDFLLKCFVKNPTKRWTAEMLLDHPFMAQNNTIPLKERRNEESPRGPFDFPDWVSVQSSTNSEFWSDMELKTRNDSPAARLRDLVSDQGCNWSDSEEWVTVRW